jgi:hypothetical protein
MKSSSQWRMPRRIALVLVLVVVSSLLAATAATASASSPDANPPEATSTLAAAAPTSLTPLRTSALAAASARIPATSASYRRAAPKPKARRVTTSKPRVNTFTYASATRHASTVTRRTTTRATTTTRRSSGSELAQARSILAGYIAKYPICKGATVYIGKTPGGSEGCVYLGSGTIVINPNHTSSLSYIIGHEIQHLREYRESHS